MIRRTYEFDDDINNDQAAMQSQKLTLEIGVIDTYPIMIHVMRSIAELFRCWWIESNCKQIKNKVTGLSITGENVPDPSPQ